MTDFGVCEASDCELSYNCKAIDLLFERVAVVEDRERRHADIGDMLPHLKHLQPFFQPSVFCSKCAGTLYRVTQPTADLQHGSDEYVRRSRLNKLLETGYKLQAWGVLPD
jgi:hypothetical protein